MPSRIRRLVNKLKRRIVNKLKRRIVNKLKRWINGEPLAVTMDRLTKTRQMLEKEQASLIAVVSQERKKAKEFAGEKNKRMVHQCLKKKELYERQLKLLENFILQITDQMIMLRGAKVCTKTADALGAGAAAARKLQKAANVYAVMDVVNKEKKSMGRMQEAIPAPSGADSDKISEQALSPPSLPQG